MGDTPVPSDTPVTMVLDTPASDTDTEAITMASVMPRLRPIPTSMEAMPEAMEMASMEAMLMATVLMPAPTLPLPLALPSPSVAMEPPPLSVSTSPMAMLPPDTTGLTPSVLSTSPRGFREDYIAATHWLPPQLTAAPASALSTQFLTAG